MTHHIVVHEQKMCFDSTYIDRCLCIYGGFLLVTTLQPVLCQSSNSFSLVDFFLNVQLCFIFAMFLRKSYNKLIKCTSSCCMRFYLLSCFFAVAVAAASVARSKFLLFHRVYIFLFSR